MPKWWKTEREKRLPQINVSIGDYFYMRYLIEMRCWSDGCEMKVRNIQPIIEIKWGRNIPKSQSMQWKNEWKVISWKRQTAMRLPLLSTAASAAIREITLRACFGPINLSVYYLDFTFTWPWYLICSFGDFWLKLYLIIHPRISTWTV